MLHVCGVRLNVGMTALCTKYTRPKSSRLWNPVIQIQGDQEECHSAKLPGTNLRTVRYTLVWFESHSSAVAQPSEVQQN
jgi:hypothetical protein